MENYEKHFQPILPFDHSAGANFQMYDSEPYKKDNEVCNAENIVMESGNVCKFYRYIVKEPCPIGGK